MGQERTVNLLEAPGFHLYRLRESFGAPYWAEVRKYANEGTWRTGLFNTAEDALRWIESHEWVHERAWRCARLRSLSYA